MGGTNQDCTSCGLGKYLTGGRCLTCDPQGMV
jgi:cysteine-rich repeat protein